MEPPLARIVWHGDSRSRVRVFPSDARESIGFQLDRLQRGLEPRDWKPMSIVGAGVREIRIHAGNEYRVLYVTQFGGKGRP